MQMSYEIDSCSRNIACSNRIDFFVWEVLEQAIIHKLIEVYL